MERKRRWTFTPILKDIFLIMVRMGLPQLRVVLKILNLQTVILSQNLKTQNDSAKKRTVYVIFVNKYGETILWASFASCTFHATNLIARIFRSKCTIAWNFLTRLYEIQGEPVCNTRRAIVVTPIISVHNPIILP